MVEYAMKIKLAITLCLLVNAATAQTLPLACEQYLTALDACTQNMVQYLERVDIKRLREVRQKQQEVRGLRALLKKEVASKGYDVIAEHCTKPEFTRAMFDELNSLITPLALLQVLNSQCYGKFQEIRVR